MERQLLARNPVRDVVNRKGEPLAYFGGIDHGLVDSANVPEAANTLGSKRLV